MNTEASIITALKQKGHRLTQARRAVIGFILTQVKPFSALDVHNALSKKGVKTDKVTVYRELALLASEGFLHDVQFDDGVKRYELAALDHHHHLVCIKCKKIDDIHMEHDLDTIEKTIRKQKKFDVLRHSLEFYGLCARCTR
ncbi:MAG TPA: Fur family transcriptional regulator [Candidatus Peribacteraceae bacterium]|nr:Fur family transcriptional regulator [Candidatus Peribacteraceae bacterium]